MLNLSGSSGDASIEGAAPLIKSPHRLAEATAHALLSKGIAAASIWEHRESEGSSMKVNLQDALIFSGSPITACLLVLSSCRQTVFTSAKTGATS